MEAKKLTTISQAIKQETIKPKAIMPQAKPQAKLQTTKPQAKLQTIKPQAKLQTTKPQAKAQTIKPEAKSQTIKPEAKMQTIKPEAKMQAIKPEGILPAQIIARMITAQHIFATEKISSNQIQPASLDLRLGERAYRIRASFLPGKERKISETLKNLSYGEMDLTKSCLLETSCVYLIPLIERLRLPVDVGGFCNPKSSTGRIDVFTRVITDYGVEFDKVQKGYDGCLYLEVSPHSFPIMVRKGSRLAQIRFFRGKAYLSDEELLALHTRHPLINMKPNIDNGLGVSVDLRGDKNQSLIGFRAKRHRWPIDVDKTNYLNVKDFWDPIDKKAHHQLVLDPNEFYILSSREAISIPETYAGELVPFNPLMGEFRVHYAGFFDPGFGLAQAGGQGARAVLEVRSHDVPFILEHGQMIGRLMYETLSEAPSVLYGTQIQSHYQKQGLRLSKYFKQDEQDKQNL